ncbi:helix-turn-helix domain-containing protein [Frankia sp. Mgl5]|uniref:helix-turn-helix domain-containing protein n=1 Tax=Frankia sp. Mgl5 TaxID=2933793 RepID=UPI00200E5A83|nr:helix-turn-helix transcriptional regulator [Frankia sp. Mgl5]MCK9929994.1 helix-turn-helix domain-containing protein [Frankia sp. Mgl5]
MASTGIAESPRARRLREGGHWLREQREQRGWTGRHLASLVGITPTQISNYERGKDGIDDERAEGIARALNMNIIDVRRGLGLWLPEGTEATPRPSVAPEDAIRADETLTADQRELLLSMIATLRSQRPVRVGGAPTPPSAPATEQPAVPLFARPDFDPDTWHPAMRDPDGPPLEDWE